MSLENWSFAFEDFYRENITENFDSEEWFHLQQVIDPFSYRYKLANMPKVKIRRTCKITFKCIFCFKGAIFLKLEIELHKTIQLNGLNLSFLLY